MTFEKAGPDRINAVDDSGTVIAYIEKQRMGTHGHWHGYLHYLFCDPLNKIIWAGEDENTVYPDRPHIPWKSWTEAPTWFANVKEFKAYYS